MIVIRLNEIRVPERIADAITRLIFMTMSDVCHGPYEPYLD